MGKKTKSRFSFLVIFPICFLVVFLLSLALMSSPANAGDELYLTGILQSVHVKAGTTAGTITVDVISQSCPGWRIFSVDDATVLEGLQGVKVSFSINSSSCRSGETYKIISKVIRNGG